ncbi:MAG: winged helix-turn-helix domain-containing protein [Myxococcota bacterium]
MGRTLKTQKPHGREPALAKGHERSGYRVAGRLWLEKDGETWLAWGRVVLLERIRDTGSMLAAAKSMNMSYRHAWALVEDMNRLAPAPLVERATGGRGGGGTRLTPAGEEAISAFWALTTSFGEWLAAVPAFPTRQRVKKKRGRS